MSAAMTRTAPAGRTLRFITALSAKLTCPKPNARPIRHNGQVPDRNGNIFYTSITSLSHISKVTGNETVDGGRWCRSDWNSTGSVAFRIVWLNRKKEVIAFGQHTPTDHRLAERNAY